MDFELLDEQIDVNGRYIVLDVVVNNQRYMLGNYYGPNIDCPDHLNEFLSLLAPSKGQEIVAAGDFNFVINPSLDKKGGVPRTHTKARNLLLEWCELSDCMEIWRVKHGVTFDWTWRSWSPPYVYCRLDYYIISNSLCNKVLNCEIKTSFASDHRAVVLSLSNVSCSRGPGFWKFNSTLLSDKGYIKLIVDTINTAVVDNKGATPSLLFDTIKCKIRGASIKYSSNKKREEARNMKVWTERLNLLQHELPQVLNDEEEEQMMMEVADLTQKIDAVIDKTTRGQILRSRAQHYEENEKNSQYFYNLEQSNNKIKSLTRLITNNGVITEPKDILLEEVRFYSKLYTSTKGNWDLDRREQLYDKFFLPQHPVIDPKNVNELDTDLSEDEVFIILKTFSRNKSPGTDGLTAEFYEYFWEDLKKPLLDSFKYSLETGSLSMDQRQGIILL